MIKKRTTARSSSLFLMELILAILFFSVAASICVQLFVKARLMSQEANLQNTAVTACTSAAETILAAPNTDAVLKNLQTVYPEADISALPMDTKLSLTSSLYVTFYAADGLLCADLSYQTAEAKEPVYTVSISKYIAGGADNDR